VGCRGRILGGVAPRKFRGCPRVPVQLWLDDSSAAAVTAEPAGKAADEIKRCVLHTQSCEAAKEPFAIEQGGKGGSVPVVLASAVTQYLGRQRLGCRPPAQVSCKYDQQSASTVRTTFETCKTVTKHAGQSHLEDSISSSCMHATSLS
jgi:hypothetical protein